MSETLTDILTRYGAIMLDIDAAEGEVDDEIAARLTEAEGALEDKIERIEALCEALNGKARSVRARVAALEAHARACEGKAQRIHEWATSQLEAAGVDKFETPSYTLSQRKSPPRLEVANEPALISWLRDHRPDLVEIVERIEKRGVLELVKKGEAVPGAGMVRGMHWRVG